MPLPSTFPDLVSLDLLVSVVELGSVSKAAAAHAMTQPSASARIAGLERHLGLVLLHRDSGGSVPTEAGGAVAEWAERLLAMAFEVDAGTRALSAKGRRLRVAATATVAAWHLPAWLAGLQRTHPGAVVSSQRAEQVTVVDQVRTGRVDLGFVEGPGVLLGLASVPVGLVPVRVVVPPSHPWARRRVPLPAPILAATPWVVRAPTGGSALRAVVAAGLRRAGHVVVAPALEGGSDREVVAAVERGVGPGLVPERAVGPELSEGRLVVVELEGNPLMLRLRAVWTGPEPGAGPAADLLALARRSV